MFVAPTRVDDADGTQANPSNSIAQAVQVAGAESKVVIACSGNYDEQLTLRAGVHLCGGFGCPGAGDAPWTYHADARAVVATSARGAVLLIKDVRIT